MHDNVLNIDLSPATAIFVYLVPEGMRAMRPVLLEALQRGVRIVTYGIFFVWMIVVVPCSQLL